MFFLMIHVIALIWLLLKLFVITIDISMYNIKSTKGKTRKLHVCNMILFNKLFLGLDGRYFTRLVTEKIQWPNALTVDYTTDRVYWGDAREDRIESVSWNGTNRSDS